MQTEQKNYQLLCKAADDANINLNQNYGRFTSIELTSLSDVPDSEDDMPEKIKVQAKTIDGLVDDPMKHNRDRLRYIRKFISNKVFILTPYKINDEYYGKQIHIYDVDKYESLKNNNNFAPVPILTSETVVNADDKESFEQLLKDRKTLGSFSNPWPTKDFTPYAIIWKDNTGLYIYTDIKKSAYSGVISFSVNSLKSFYKPINWLDNRFVVDGHVAFIDKDSLVGSKSRENDLSYNTDETETNEEQIDNTNETETNEEQINNTDETETNEEQINNTDETETNEEQINNTDETETNEEQINNTDEIEASEEQIDNTDETEIGNEKSIELEKNEMNKNGVKAMDNQRDEIFENFEDCVRNKYGLTYDNKDLVNFHNSLKTNLLTILAGISGTGKSKIVTAYADSLGIKKDKKDKKDNDEQFNMVSVRPFWQDDSDLLGFVDTISNTYHPGDSGIVDTLISANKNRDKMYIIVFDEMNLARVEHYFSQFLSVLEKDPIDRKLQLYNKKLQARLYNGDQYPAELLIPENVRFVGTMNIDETTYQMSDKVLDRANVITLKSVKFANRLNNRIEYDNNYEEVGSKVYEDSIRKDYSFSNNQLQFFDQLNSCINKQLPTVGIGWRTLNSIEKFVGDIDNHNYDNFNIDDAFDYQVAQRILPKIRGTKLMLNILLDPDRDESIYKILDNYRYISDFPFTRELLDKKKREIEVIGFAN